MQKEDNEDNSYMENVLRGLGIVAKIFSPINRLLEERYPNEIKLTLDEVMDFLKFPKDLLIQSGFSVLLPEAFSIGGTQRLTARLIIQSKQKKKQGKISTHSIPAVFDANSLLEYKWDAHLGGEKISDADYDNLINSDQPLVNLNNKWILVKQQDLEDLRNAKNLKIDNYMDALKLGLMGSIQIGENENEYEVIVQGELGDIVDKLKSIEKFEEINTPPSFNGTLRPYQRTALSWMGNMYQFNFGLCLADDMGLGKTIQVIALILHLKEIYPEINTHFMIICPTSLLATRIE